MSTNYIHLQTMGKENNGKYNNNGISRYGNSQGGTPFCLRQEVPNKLSYNGIFKVDSSVWRDITSQDGGRSGSGDVIVGLHDGNRIRRVSPDRRHMATTIHAPYLISLKEKKSIPLNGY